MHKNTQTFGNISFILSHLWKCSPMRVISTFVFYLISSFVEVIIGVVMLRFIINGIQTGIPFGHLLLGVSITMFGVLMLLGFQDWYQNVYLPRSDLKTNKYFDELIFDKIIKVDLEYYDSKEFFDKYSRAIKESRGRAVSVLNDLANLISSITILFSLATLLFTMDPILIIFAFTPIVFSLPLSIIRNKLNYRYNKDRTLDDRKLNYYRLALHRKEYAKEIKMTNISDVLFKNYDNSYKNLVEFVKKYGIKRMGIGFWETFNQIIIVMYATYIYLIYKIVVSKTLLIGDFMSLYNAVRNTEYSLRKIIEIVPKMHEHGMFIQDLKELLNIETKIKDPQNAVSIQYEDGDIILENASFAYNNETSKVLSDISMRIKEKQKIAIVGRNGAGKSTLIKIILRMYEPLSGNIQYNNKQYESYNVSDYRSLFSTVFQDFAIYNVSVAENVLMGLVKTKEDEKRVINALKRVGLYDKVKKAKDGIYTDISKEFSDNGLVLSGGEEQKLAIARAFCNSSKILIFDEASSALDPIAEYEMNNLILSLAKDKTVILISHRLSTTRDVDMIYFLEDGRVKEQGSHEQLMQLNGEYARMFNIQSKQYLKKVSNPEEEGGSQVQNSV